MTANVDWAARLTGRQVTSLYNLNLLSPSSAKPVTRWLAWHDNFELGNTFVIDPDRVNIEIFCAPPTKCTWTFVASSTLQDLFGVACHHAGLSQALSTLDNVRQGTFQSFPKGHHKEVPVAHNARLFWESLHMRFHPISYTEASAEMLWPIGSQQATRIPTQCFSFLKQIIFAV